MRVKVEKRESSVFMVIEWLPEEHASRGKVTGGPEKSRRYAAASWRAKLPPNLRDPGSDERRLLDTASPILSHHRNR